MQPEGVKPLDPNLNFMGVVDTPIHQPTTSYLKHCGATFLQSYLISLNLFDAKEDHVKSETNSNHKFCQCSQNVGCEETCMVL